MARGSKAKSGNIRHCQFESVFEPRGRVMAATEGDHGEAHGEHDIWVHLTPDVRKELKAEDSDAWKAVVGVLIFIIVVGLVLAVFTASLSWLW
jgi:hypothetical protein